MSLLPEFNEKFEDLLYDTINEDTEFAKDRWRSPELWATCASLRALQKLLNPDLNPLTLEEVKAWFDRKVADDRYPFNIHILAGQENAYRIIKEPAISKIKSYFFLHKNGFTQSGMDCDFIIPYEPEIIFNHLPEGLITTPLELFCQMKGYIEF